ncbi:nuclear transport factor 2 family protein [Algoriphagus sediminis]|uniref:Nuclear transport factor 2 family protein n=1 Tax=Algoriphagus sediminis TaxID=3057113 RepID=A0ABT7YED1_9BACT|nr:nuclear transport factor 2 family protein [Algoriphagus sediminis]MDN3204878.1 nuclear transport factor 2 family protein [Algoriphagus sediminis]
MKNLIGFLVLLLGFSVSSFSQESKEKEQIAATVQLYFDGMMERDRAKLDKAFASEARLIGFRKDQYTVTEYEDWASGTASGEPRDISKYKNNLVVIHVNGTTAVAETELFWPGIYYYDYLTLLKIDGAWKIVHKSWTSRVLD